MGLLHRLLGGKLPGWAKSSPHDAKSAAALVEAIQRYVLDNGATIELSEDSAKVTGPRGERVVKFGDFVFICPADSTETWDKMIAHALRDVIPDAAVTAEARTSLELLLREKQEQLDAIAASPELAQAHLRLMLRVHGFRVEVPALMRPVKRSAFDRFEALAIYDFLANAEGLPASHLANWSLDDDAILARAEENTFAAEATQSGDRVVSIAGPFAGSRIVAPARLGDSVELGLLISAPHRDLCMVHRVNDASVLAALDEIVNRTYELHDEGPVGGTGRALFWWRKGVFQEIPTNARTIVREGSLPYEYRLPDRFKRDVLKPLGIEG